MSEHCADCRRRDRQGLIISGMTGGGFLLAGFGLPWAIIGMILGGLAGYLVSRRRHQAGGGA